MKKLFLFLFAAILFNLQAQNSSQPRICGTPVLPQQFEVWLNSVTPSTSNPKYNTSSIQSVFNIPVIVHVIHNNEPVNSNSATSGNNLSALQIQNQINILNADFNGLNADTTLIPTIFKPAFGKFQINFCMAVVNPTGGILAEPGIDRINRVAKGWSAPPYSITYCDATIKPTSIWDPNKYLNIWVSGLTGGILGYATFPNPGASGISGLSAPYGSSTSDGVVILNTSFGSIGTAQFGAYNRGRTATHEIGHWLGLRHIWGDGNCATDYVNDTPTSQTANYGCPSFPYKVGVCSGNTTGEMTMNYMDYTDDACMYMFTNDQKYRAQLILVNSSIRAALITSTVCNLPAIGNDIGISFVARPTFSQTINCINYIDPIINLTNFGSTTLNSFTISYNVDGVNTQTMVWTGTVNPNTSFTLAIPQITALSLGAHLFSVTVGSPNGGSDLNLSNNYNVQNFIIANPFNVTVNSPTACAGTTISLQASGATNYTWTGVGTTGTVIVTPSATTVYTVTATNSVCSVVRTTTVQVTPGPTISVNSATACGGIPVTLSASGAGSYTWSTSSNNSSVTVTANATTNYTVSGTNSLNCSSSKVATLTILLTPTVAANNSTVCAGGTTTLFASGANSYSWSTGALTSFIPVTPTANTVYTVTGTIGTCTNEKTVSITVGSALSIFVNVSSPVICNGNSVTLSASGANTYTWSTNSNNSSISVTPSVTTAYTVNGLSGTCPGVKIVTITVNQLPQTTISSTNVSCFGGFNGQIAATSTGNGPFTYGYLTGSVNLAAGTHSVSTTDANGCVSGTTAIVSQPAPLTSQSGAGITNCPAACDATAQVSFSGGTGPYTSTLFPTGNTGQTFSNLCAGLYTYLMNDFNGCIGSGTFAVIAGNAGIVVTSSVTHVSCSSCTNATLTANGNNGTGPYTYTWMPGNSTGAELTGAGVGCYTVYAEDSQGCSGSTENCVTFDVGISQLNANQKNISVFPNPGDGRFTVHLPFEGVKTVEVFDALGQLVSSNSTYNTQLEIDISVFASGLYYARVQMNSDFSVIKIRKN